MKFAQKNNLNQKVFFFLCLIGGLLSLGWSAPSVQLYGGKASSEQNFKVYVSFSDSVTGLSKADVTVNNGTVSAVSGTGKYYEIFVQATKPGDVTVNLPANVANATQGFAGNTPSNTFVTNANYEEGLVTWKVDNSTDWNRSGSDAVGMSLNNGEAKPIGNEATYSSAIKTFEKKMKPRNIVFKQSPVWDNWTGVSNVGPSGAGDAPIFLPVGNDDYYFFGNKNNVYQIWHSTDMTNWTNYGPIMESPSVSNVHFKRGRWATSAEYKDGKFYIIVDTPNDSKPTLVRDDNLKDRKFGEVFDVVFDDPTGGSDASLFRDDSDGLFHIIYEDWTPIKANSHSWDSPLAGHTSSPDAINGFIPHKHVPAVDVRTTPTGEVGSYNHPAMGILQYDIHSPAQDAFGDWTTIKVGGQYYLFGDYEEHGDGISTGRLTSRSIYEEFKYVGETGTGHPDPTVGFAEGQFYLITQQNTDQISPGPWVEEVEARAGVDVDGNGSIDQWTAWKIIKENYDHKPGYARVVDVAPAELDLSSLPEGLGFKFEFKVTDKTSNASTPIMDKVEMNFEPLESGSNVMNNQEMKENALNWKKQGSQHVLSYVANEAGYAIFVFYNLQGKAVKTIKKYHEKPGAFTMTFEQSNTLSWNVVEYSTKDGLSERVQLTK